MNEKAKHKSYLGFILDMEETIMSIDEIINQLEKHCSSLGIKRKFHAPEKRHVESKDSSYAGWVAGFIVGAIVAIIKISFGVSGNKNSGIFGGLFSTFGEFMMGVIIGAVVGLIFGLIVNAIAKSKKDDEVQKIADKEYESELEEYNRSVKQDQDRVDVENKQKSYIYEQISLLKEKKQSSIEIAEKIYSYNLIDKKYWHNISALSYFNQYYIKPLDKSSFDDAKSAYERAYSDYEEDLSRKLIVTNPKDIINSSDYSIRKQRDLFRIMKDLYSKTSTISKEIISEAYNRNTPLEDTAVYRFSKEKEETEKLCSLIIVTIFN